MQAANAFNFSPEDMGSDLVLGLIVIEVSGFFLLDRILVEAKNKFTFIVLTRCNGCELIKFFLHNKCKLLIKIYSSFILVV